MKEKKEEKKKVLVSAYYGKPSFYSVMPPVVFDALESAYLKCEEFAEVDACAYARMCADYRTKVASL